MRIVDIFKSGAGRLAADKAGNFGIMTALIIPVILAAVAISMDMSRLLADKTKLSSALDAASLATASALTSGDITTAEAQGFAARIAAGQLANVLSPSQITELKGTLAAGVTPGGSGSTKTYTVKVTGQFTDQLMAFSTFHAGGTRTINGSSTSTSQSQSTNAISLYLVVDRSGSMSWVTDTRNTSQYYCYNYYEQSWPYGYYQNPCYISKAQSLKTAAAKLFDTMDSIESSDPSNTVVRTGTVSFNDDQQSPSNLAWGTSASRKYVNNLPDYPTGGTDMTDAVATATDALTSSSEANKQSGKGNTTFYKYMVLMTDGENTGSSGSWNPALDAMTLTTCTEARAAGVTIFTVAYMAPPNGETLLKSCSGDVSNFYKATDMASLVKAFTDIGNKVSKQTTRMTN